jgi:hypothetical protein
VTQLTAIRIAAALLIVVGIAWMLGTAKYASFFSTFGDCAPEDCGGYYGTWETTARFYRLIGPLGLATFVVAVAAIVFRLAQIALFAISVVMIATLALSFVVPLREMVIPGIDVYVGSFTTVFLIQLPAAMFWLAGASLGLLAVRIDSGMAMGKSANSEQTLEGQDP